MIELIYIMILILAWFVGRYVAARRINKKERVLNAIERIECHKMQMEWWEFRKKNMMDQLKKDSVFIKIFKGE